MQDFCILVRMGQILNKLQDCCISASWPCNRSSCKFLSKNCSIPSKLWSSNHHHWNFQLKSNLVRPSRAGNFNFFKVRIQPQSFHRLRCRITAFCTNMKNFCILVTMVQISNKLQDHLHLGSCVDSVFSVKKIWFFFLCLQQMPNPWLEHLKKFYHDHKDKMSYKQAMKEAKKTYKKKSHDKKKH